MYQYTVIAGNVGRDVTLRYLANGTPVADFSVAVNKKWTGQDGQTNEKTTWFRVTCWNKLAETVNQYVTKGRQVLVTGEVEASAWINNDGEAASTLELTARDVKFLGRRDDDGGNQYENPNRPGDPGYSTDLQDIPF